MVNKKNFTILVFSYTAYMYFIVVRTYTKLEDSGSDSRWGICDRFYVKERKMDKDSDKHERKMDK